MNNFFLFASESNTGIVCLVGVGVVFLGLALLIGIIEIMNRISDKFADKKTTPEPAPTPVAAAPTAGAPIENRAEIIAAVCAAVAEENGTDISAIRVVSFKKL